MDKELHHLLTRYVNGECTPDEIRKVNRWYEGIAERNLDLSEGDAEMLRHRILADVRGKLWPQAERRSVRRYLGHGLLLRAAAAVGVIAVTAGLWVATSRMPHADGRFAEGSGIAKEVVFRNSSGVERVYHLPDGSTVKLDPASRITFRGGFSREAREVHLMGRAFFQIVKDASRPFYVYSGKVATRVLGTSFVVDAPEGAAKVEVKVMTGRVSVFEIPDERAPGAARILRQENGHRDSVILSPNQKVEFFVKDRHWVTGLVEDPLPVKPLTETEHSFVFASARMDGVLREINERFAIEIAVENSNIYNCTFTGDVSALTLYDLLDIVCTSIGATYTVEGTHILLSGGGCK